MLTCLLRYVFRWSRGTWIGTQKEIPKSFLTMIGPRVDTKSKPPYKYGNYYGPLISIGKIELSLHFNKMIR